MLIDYQQHIMNEELDIVFDYLGIGNEFDFVNKRIKLNKQSNILDRFVSEDHKEIIQCLEEINKPHWITENQCA